MALNGLRWQGASICGLIGLLCCRAVILWLLSSTYMDEASGWIWISPVCAAGSIRRHTWPGCHCRPAESTHADCSARPTWIWKERKGDCNDCNRLVDLIALGMATANTHAFLKQAQAHLTCFPDWVHKICISFTSSTHLGELMLWQGTSRLWPSSSWLRSTMPQGAMPMLTTRPVRCWPSRSRASPTCLVTPVCREAEEVQQWPRWASA